MRHSSTAWRFGSQITPSLKVMLPEGHVHFQAGEVVVRDESVAEALIRQMPKLPGVTLLAVGRQSETVGEFIDGPVPVVVPEKSWWRRG